MNYLILIFRLYSGLLSNFPHFVFLRILVFVWEELGLNSNSNKSVGNSALKLHLKNYI